MNREERHRILGPEIVAHISDLVDAAPEPTPEVVEHLRRIMTRPAGSVPETWSEVGEGAPPPNGEGSASRPCAPSVDAGDSR